MSFKVFKTWLSVCVLGTSLMVSSRAKAQTNYQGNPAKEFIMSCTYGVLAGTLVGTAILAFEDQPGDNLNKVARGASIGFYAGILLGLYVVYGVSEGEDNFDPYNQQGLPPAEGFRQRSFPRFQASVAPTLDDSLSIDGAAAVLKWNLF
jgi:hypothetical protein